MPFYEYECSACKFYVEALQKISDPPMKKCPSCKKQTLKKLVSAPVFRLKGAGWYETDFKSDQDKKRNLVDGSDKESVKEAKDSNEGAKEATKTDKPDTAKATETAKSGAESASSKSSRSSAAKKPAPKAKPKAAAKKK